MRWYTGATDLITTPRRGPDRAPPDALATARRLGPLLTDQDLADHLNQHGHRTGKGRPYDIKAVRWIRHAYKIRASRTEWRRAGEVTVKQAAARLGISADAIYYWLGHGLTPGRKDPSGRWCIPGHPTPKPPTNSGSPNHSTSNPQPHSSPQEAQYEPPSGQFHTVLAGDSVVITLDHTVVDHTEDQSLVAGV